MIGFLMARVIKWGVPPEIAKLISWLLILVVGIALLGIGKCSYDHAIIRNHDAKVDASAAKADRAADQKAADQKAADTQREAQEATQLQKAVTNAPKDPNIDDRVERNLAFHRCLRLQQRARANGLEPPVCV